MTKIMCKVSYNQHRGQICIIVTYLSSIALSKNLNRDSVGVSSNWAEAYRTEIESNIMHYMSSRFYISFLRVYSASFQEFSTFIRGFHLQSPRFIQHSFSMKYMKLGKFRLLRACIKQIMFSCISILSDLLLFYFIRCTMGNQNQKAIIKIYISWFLFNYNGYCVLIFTIFNQIDITCKLPIFFLFLVVFFQICLKVLSK